MKDIEKLLEKGVDNWREEVKINRSLWSDMPVKTESPIVPDSDSPFLPDKIPEKEWLFHTDGSTVYTVINDPARLESKFQNIAPQFWEEDSEKLAEDVFTYLPFHELYHPIYAPFSEEDRARTNYAAKKGIEKAEPDLNQLEVMGKVRFSHNSILDMMVDTKFALENNQRDLVESDIITLYDVFETHGTPFAELNSYHITRYLGASLFGPETVENYFKKRVGSEGVSVAEESLGSLLERDVDLSSEDRLDRENYLKQMEQKFSDLDERYDAISRFMTELAPYVPASIPMSPGLSMPVELLENMAGDEELLEDLLDTMTDEEAEDFIEEITEELDQKGNGDLRLQHRAMHEFYKRNNASIDLSGSGTTGQSIVEGIENYYDVQDIELVPKEELANRDLEAFLDFQESTGNPKVVMDGEKAIIFDYNERKRQKREVGFVNDSIDLPGAVEFYLDSSGSMLEPDWDYDSVKGFKDNSKWDQLTRVFYGLTDAIIQGENKTDLQSRIRIHNFASETVSTELIDPKSFWDGSEVGLDKLFRPENGSGTRLELDEYSDGLSRTYVVVTDGEVAEWENLYEQIDSIAQRDKLNYFEVGENSELGYELEEHPEVKYYSVDGMEEIVDQGIEILF